MADYTCDIRMEVAAADLQTACGDSCGSGCMQMQQFAVRRQREQRQVKHERILDINNRRR